MNTRIKTNPNTKWVFIVMNVVAWLAFIGFMIQAGAIVISYVVSYSNPVAAKNLYMGLDLSGVKQYSFEHYSLSVAFMVGLLCIKAFVSYLAIKALLKVNMANPFKMEVSQLLQRMSYILLMASVLGIVNNLYIDWLTKRTGVQQEQWGTGDILFFAGLVFIIAQIFKRGVEIQSENDLTV